jgi:hypothetical protein
MYRDDGTICKSASYCRTTKPNNYNSLLRSITPTLLSTHHHRIMERLFSTCTRLRDTLQNQGRLPYLGLREGDLDVSTEELLSAERAFTYADLYAMLVDGDTVAWMTPHTAITRGDGLMVASWYHSNGSCSLRFNADGEVLIARAFSPEHLLEICDVVLRLLGASVVHSVTLRVVVGNSRGIASISAPTLAYLLEQCQSLKVLTLNNLEMDEHHCRVLGDHSRPDLKIELNRCKFTSAETSALAEILGRNRGPTKLDQCLMDDYSILAYGLRGNSRLNSLKLFFPGNSTRSREDGNRQLLAIADALQENEGLVELSLSNGSISVNDGAWGAVCDSLQTHPTLKVLDLRVGAGTVVISRMQALVNMMNRNTTIHTVHVDVCYRVHELYSESVIPYLETNRFRPRVLAIQQTRSIAIAYRAKVLGRALLATRSDANGFWMLLSGNAEVAFSRRLRRPRRRL